VPVQVAVQLRIANGLDIEGILLDLSEDGLEVLSSQPLSPSASLALDFALSGGGIRVQAEGTAVWASPNGQAGVRFLNLNADIRNTLREWVSSHARRYSMDETESEIPCRLTDLSQGGCYVDTISPYPERSEVILYLKAGEVELQAQGMVRVMHPGCGMGVEFASATTQQQKDVASFIHFLADNPGLAPELLVAPRALADTSSAAETEFRDEPDLQDPLLELLRGHESLTQDEFLRQLRGQRRNPALMA
jgi:hypothetical protein